MSCRKISLSVALLLLSNACCIAQSNDNSSKDVEDAFESYRSALSKKDGKAAADAVSSATIQAYQEYRDLALTGDEITIKGLSMIDRMQVLLVRHRLDSKLLKSMDGLGLFGYAVDQNWIGKDAVVRAGVQNVAVRDARATAKVSVDGKATAELFHFVKEEGRWKFDLIPTIKKSDQTLQAAARARGLTEDEFLFSIISSISGRKVTEEIWKPLD